MEYFISLDVGGTGIKACTVGEDGNMRGDVTNHPAMSERGMEEIINNISDIIINKVDNTAALSGIAIAFPGPFDYDRGISKIKGIGKYDAIYNINIGEALAHKTGNMAQIKFVNDADMFAISAYRNLGFSDYKRIMAICIGTGIGSAFLENGKWVKTGNSVPQNGWIYNTPFKDGIIDSYISATGLRRMIKEMGALAADVKDLDDLARQGDPKALAIYSEFSEMMCDALVPFLTKFDAECLVIGGQVAKGFEFYGDKLKERLKSMNITLKITEKSDVLTILGAPFLFM